MRALREHRFNPSRGAYARESRGFLAAYIRTTIKAARALTVGSHCKMTLNALAGGYAIALTPTGRQADQPVDNPYRTLIEGVEALVAAMNASSKLNAGANTAISAEGQPYITSRPGVVFRR